MFPEQHVLQINAVMEQLENPAQEVNKLPVLHWVLTQPAWRKVTALTNSAFTCCRLQYRLMDHSHETLTSTSGGCR